MSEWPDNPEAALCVYMHACVCECVCGCVCVCVCVQCVCRLGVLPLGGRGRHLSPVQREVTFQGYGNACDSAALVQRAVTLAIQIAPLGKEHLIIIFPPGAGAVAFTLYRKVNVDIDSQCMNVAHSTLKLLPRRLILFHFHARCLNAPGSQLKSSSSICPCRNSAHLTNWFEVLGHRDGGRLQSSVLPSVHFTWFPCFQGLKHWDGWMGMDGWRDGWMDGGRDGWMDRKQWFMETDSRAES